MTVDTAALEALSRLQVAADSVATEDEARQVADTIRAFVRSVKAAQWEPYPWQHPHTHPPDWISERAPGVCDQRCYQLPPVRIPAQGMWLEYGGRGTGKTEGAAHYVNAHAQGPACDDRIRGGHKMLIIAPTQGDAVDACITGVSGLQTINPAVTLATARGGTFVRWPNGTSARVLGASTPEDVERLRAAGNNCVIWLEEVAAMRRLQQVMDISRFGLRIGPHAHYVGSTTPKNRVEMRALSQAPDTIVTRGRTRDAHRLNPEDRAKWEERFGGTTIGRQELDAEEIGDVEGALWVAVRELLLPDGELNPDERPGIENDRVPIGSVGWTSHRADAPVVTAPLMMSRTIISVDPPGGRTEAGIVVHGFVGQHAYVLADLSLAGPPDTWARVVLDAYLDYGCEGIAAEHTYGGDMVTDVIATRVTIMENEGRWPPGIGTPPIFKVPTKVGKRLRAEPVQGLYQQHRIHHVGFLPGLETEQTSWVPAETVESPNRLDAHVHGITYGLIRVGAGKVSNPASSAHRIRRGPGPQIPRIR